MQFRYIDLSHKNEWENLVAQNPASGFMQSFFWTDFINRLGWPTYKIGLFDNKKIIGGAVITKFKTDNGNNYLYISQGPVLLYDLPQAELIFNSLISEVDKIADLKGEKLTSHLRIDPKLTVLPTYFKRFRKSPIDLEPMRTLLVDLTQAEEQILTQMKPKGRYNIKVAQRHGLNVISVDLQTGLKDFLKFYQQTVNRKQFEGKDEKYFIDLANMTNPETAKMFFVKDQNQVLAVAIVIFYGKLATFLFGASSDQSREKMAPYLLHWEIIKQAKRMGFSEYDFYGITPDKNDLDHPWQGFTTFKQKFGGKEIKYVGGYDFVYNKKLYQDYLKTNNEI